MAELDERQAYIGAFFAALERRELALCRTQVAHLQRELANRDWATYLTGILAFEADHDFAEAERIFTALINNDLEPSLLGRILIALGRTYDVQGQWTAAIAIYERAVALFATLQQPLEQVKIWKNMAATYQKGFAQGDLESAVLPIALAYCQQALAVIAAIDASLPSVRWLENSLWNTLGALHLSLAQWNEALVAYERGMALVRQLADHYAIGIYYLNFGEVYQAQGCYQAALDAYQQALTTLRPFQNPVMEMDIWANLGALYQELGHHEQALAHYDQALHLLETVRQEVSAATTRANFFATTIHHYFANAVLCAWQAGDAAKAFAYVEQARARLLRESWQPEQAILLEQATPPRSLAAVQSALPEDALVLAYFTTGLMEEQKSRFRPPEGLRRHRFPPAKTLLLAITRQTVRLIDVDLSPNKLAPHQTGAVVERHFLAPALRRLLYTKLLAPIADLLPGKRSLYLAPYGPLHFIPFAALLAADDQPLLQRAGPALSYTPSLTLLLAERRQPPLANSAPLALGYNGFSQEGAAPPLRYAEAEALMVAHLTGGQALIGARSKKAQLWLRHEQPRWLHFSCHGVFQVDTPLASRLQLGPDESLSAQEVLQSATLACDLVVLSACESGLSRAQRGDELLGLAYAFLQAGARVVLATLWRVDERATYLLMEHFYQEVQQGHSYATALHRAQLYLRRLAWDEAQDRLAQAGCTEQEPLPPADTPPFADPFYWAPYMLLVTGQLPAQASAPDGAAV